MSDPSSHEQIRKLQQLNAAAQQQLSPEEYEEFTNLVSQLQVYGVTPYINTQLGRLMAKINVELQYESPEWSQALQACDRAFLGTELKEMCELNGISPFGHKKELCRRLYHAKVPEVVAVMEPYLNNIIRETQ